MYISIIMYVLMQCKHAAPNNIVAMGWMIRLFKDISPTVDQGSPYTGRFW